MQSLIGEENGMTGSVNSVCKVIQAAAFALCMFTGLICQEAGPSSEPILKADSGMHSSVMYAISANTT